MNEARKAILGRIRGALGDVPAAERPGDVDVPRAYRRNGELGASDRVERFADRVRDYHAQVRIVSVQEVGRTVTEACAAAGLRRVVVPPGLDAAWRPEGVEVVEDAGLTPAELDEGVDGAVTGCAAAIADTGTIVLDGGLAEPGSGSGSGSDSGSGSESGSGSGSGSGRRIITLVPDHHICIVRAEQVCELVPEALAAVAGAVRGQRAPITLVSGPSASSDIELARVEGVHGPRHLLVVIAR